MSWAYAAARRVTPAKLRRRARALLLPPNTELAQRIIERTARTDSDLAPLYDLVTDEQARIHFGEEEVLQSKHYRSVVRLFHAWKLKTIRTRLGAALSDAEVLDVGDSDGLLLRHLGKTGIGFNISDAVIGNIRSNGIEAVQGDAHNLPFADESFDVVLCFETFEHVENQHTVLLELHRVLRPGGHCFMSIPWMPETVVQPRAPNAPRGRHHAFELDRDDFAALVTHTPFRLVYEDVCRLFLRPEGFAERFFLWNHRDEHIVAGTFRAFQLFELERARE